MTWVARNRLTTAHILYRMPDRLWFLQTYVWQDYDHVPGHPALNAFLEFWAGHLAGPIHSVTVADARIPDSDDFRYTEHMVRLR